MGSEKDSMDITEVISKVESIVETKLTKKEQEAKKAQQEAVLTDNGKKVASALLNRFGDKAKERFTEKARELDMDENTLNELARTQPSAVLKFFGETTNTGSKSQSSSEKVRTEANLKTMTGSSVLKEKITDYFNSGNKSADRFEAIEAEFRKQSKDE
jgi:hypothetical protein